MDVKLLTSHLKGRAKALGFSLCAVCEAQTPSGFEHLSEWLDSGYAGQMSYLADRHHAYEHPKHVLEGARSVLVMTLDYQTVEPKKPDKKQARISRYAWGDQDYHDLIRPKLHTLADELRELAPEANARGVVDTAPIMEREFAQLAGLGWIGKNTLLLNRQHGSWFFLAALITDQELVYDKPFEQDHCGTCTACLDACPTDAFVEPRVLDASRCISYLTIEHKEMPAVELRSGVKDWLFGCDVCQEVCPWNQKAPLALAENATAAFDARSENNPVDLFEILSLDEIGFKERFRGTPLWRPRRRGILRNAAIVMGNNRPEDGEAILSRVLGDEEPLVRMAAAWALGQYASDSAISALRQQLEVEAEDEVRKEIIQAVDGIAGQNRE